MDKKILDISQIPRLQEDNQNLYESEISILGSLNANNNQETRSSEHREQNSKSSHLKQAKSNPKLIQLLKKNNKKQFLEDSNNQKKYFNKKQERQFRNFSDDESDANNLNLLKNVQMQDDGLEQFSIVKKKVNFLNVLVVGGSQSGKFSFTQFLFNHCFQKQFKIDKEQKNFRQFQHVIDNGRRGQRILSVIHSKGYSQDYPKETWYKNIKEHLVSKMQEYERLKNFFSEKNNMKESIEDTRIHLCLFFISNPKISILDMVYIQKLSKYVNVIPVLTYQKNQDNLEILKLRAQQDLENNNIEFFDMQEDDLTFRQFQRDLIAQTTPFLLKIQNQQILATNSDVEVMVKMITTPYINTYYYKTELKYSSLLEKKRSKNKNNNFSKKDSNEKIDYGAMGIAVGIGIFGAFCAFKGKFINQFIFLNYLRQQ